MQAIGFRTQATGFRMQATGTRTQATGFMIQATGTRIQASGFRIQATGFRIYGMASKAMHRRLWIILFTWSHLEKTPKVRCLRPFFSMKAMAVLVLGR
jgi:hypothetical protein